MSDEIFRIHLEQLERSFRDDGESTLADLVQQIRSLPNPVAFLRKTLTPRKGRQKKHDVSFQEREAWFKSYTSQEGANLSDMEVQSLVSLTRDWELEESAVQSLQSTGLLWSKCPFIFWEKERYGNDIIVRAFNDLRKDPIRRKVLLITLSEYVEERQNNIPRESWRINTSKPDSECESRPSFCLKTSLANVTRLLWPHANDDEERKNRNQLADFSLWGWKWRQLEHPGFILSISDTPCTRYERAALTNLQRTALNSWIKTTKQFSIINELNKAWESIMNEYRHGSVLPNLSSTLPPLRPTQQTNTVVLPPMPFPISPATSAIPQHHNGPQTSGQTGSLRPGYRRKSVEKFSGLSSASPRAASNLDTGSNIQPPHPKRPCHQRQIQAGLALSTPFGNQGTNVVTREPANSSSSPAQEDSHTTGRLLSASHPSQPATSNIESSHEDSVTDDIRYILPVRPDISRQYQLPNETLTNQPQLPFGISQIPITAAGQTNEFRQAKGWQSQDSIVHRHRVHSYASNITQANASEFCDQNKGTIHDANRDNCIGRTPDSAAYHGDGAPMNQNTSFTALSYEAAHNTVQIGQQVNSESRASDDCRGDATRSHNQVGLLSEHHGRLSELSPAQVDSHELLEDLSVDGLYQVNSSELLDDISVGDSAPQVDSRELLDDLSVGDLYPQVNSSELLDDIRHARAIDIDDILREADNYTKSLCQLHMLRDN